ncbi:hypothetical protein [Mesorhizobium onobrychidis]|uniref:Uncharacterized protein n=1 Tax=Mesorhizobium onobrychidis TaxID=2775404 RepID=A0ABY5QXK0_9HYPH|nr:hypothetical protein [Mesorhizobium onobrychidis]UVC15427.1 hypothetical protein IHQ72_34115 [Mesorhizobium onobrychidis]
MAELDIRRYVLDAGVADQDIEAPEGFDRLHQPLSNCPSLRQPSFVNRSIPDAVVGLRCDQDARTTLAPSPANRAILADPARGFGDQRQLVKKPATGSPSRWFNEISL